MTTDTSRDDSAPARPATAVADSLEVLERAPLTFHVRTRRQIIAAYSTFVVGYFAAAHVLNRLEAFYGWVAIGFGILWPLSTALIVRRVRRRGSEDGLTP